jgi:predicted dehydrogenase
LRRLGVGMIGYGFMGKMHSYAYASLPFVYDPPPARLRFAGVCAQSEESRAVAMERAGYAFATDDYRELVARDDVDIVNVCTPNYLHREQVLAALEAGKHVYCDKPLAMNTREAEEMVEAARKAGTTCQVTFHNRYSPAIMRAKQLVEDGFLGEITAFRAVYLHAGYTDPNRPISWRMQREKAGGGALVDLGSHVIDLLGHLIGNFSRVRAELRTLVKERPISAGSSEMAPVTVDDAALVELELPSGVVGTMEASRVATGAQDDMRFEIHGTRGAMRFELMDLNWLWVYDSTKPHAPLGGDRGWTRVETIQNYPKPAALPGGRSPVGWMRLHIASIHEFVRNVVDGKPGSPSFEEGLAVQRVMDPAIRSSETGSWESMAG